MTYGEMHRFFLRTVASQGVISIIDAQAILERFNDEEQLLSVTDLVKAINNEIRPYYQEIKITKDEVTNEEVVVFLSLANDTANKAHRIFSCTELDYIWVLIQHIMNTESRQITGINAINLISSMESNFTTTDAQELLNTWCRMQYLIKIQDNYALGVRAIHEFKGDFPKNMPHAVEKCFLCKHIVFKGYNCPGCAQAVHTKCLLLYLQSIQKWPCCKIDIKEELLERLKNEGLSSLHVSDSTRHYEENNTVAEPTQVQETSEIMNDTQEVISENSQRVIRKRKRKNNNRLPQTQVATTHPPRSGKGSRNKRPTADSPCKQRSGQLNFTTGMRSQAEVGTPRPTPSQQATIVRARLAIGTSKTNRKDKAATKRSINETLPLGEHKRPRLDQSKRGAQRSQAQAANAILDVAITCDRTEILSKEVSDQVLTAIQKKIILEACSPKQDTPGPTFNAKPLFAGGVIKLWCGNDHTLAWLRKTVSDLSLPTGTSLVVKSQSEIQKRARCGIVIPDEQGVFGEPTNIGRALSYQNPWVDIKKWKLLHADKQAAAWFVVLGVPVDQIPTLMEAGRRLSIGLGAVYVKFQNRNGKFTDIPQGWDAATGTICETQNQLPQAPAGKSTTPSNNPEESATVPAAAESAASAVSSTDEELDNLILPSALSPGGNGFDEGELFAGLRYGETNK